MHCSKKKKTTTNKQTFHLFDGNAISPCYLSISRHQRVIYMFLITKLNGLVTIFGNKCSISYFTGTETYEFAGFRVCSLSNMNNVHNTYFVATLIHNVVHHFLKSSKVSQLETTILSFPLA